MRSIQSSCHSLITLPFVILLLERMTLAPAACPCNERLWLHDLPEVLRDANLTIRTCILITLYAITPCKFSEILLVPDFAPYYFILGSVQFNIDQCNPYGSLVKSFAFLDQCSKAVVSRMPPRGLAKAFKAIETFMNALWSSVVGRQMLIPGAVPLHTLGSYVQKV
ncbi:hypothetical protein VNO77_19354 [Canavalia gladiata]|uniref:Uncharacterized protein n=1 Tax=Canavalia gladiata TaxID=3824 RepID=A0AAN9LQS9_CANGL